MTPSPNAPTQEQMAQQLNEIQRLIMQKTALGEGLALVNHGLVVITGALAAGEMPVDFGEPGRFSEAWSSVTVGVDKVTKSLAGTNMAELATLEQVVLSIQAHMAKSQRRVIS